MKKNIVEIKVNEETFNLLRGKGAVDVHLNKKGEELLYKVMGVFHAGKGGDDLVLLEKVKKKVKP